LRIKEEKRQIRRKILKPNPDYFPPDIAQKCPEGFVYMGRIIPKDEEPNLLQLWNEHAPEN
jgi:hypothetical protein